MELLDQGWTEEQAQGLLDALEVSHSVPNWKPAYLQTLYDWCGQRRKNPKTIEAQLDFIAYEICNFHEDFGKALKQARTRGEARLIAERFVKQLTAQQAAPSGQSS
jgi:hypothetical protein